MRPHRPVNQYSTEPGKKATGWGKKFGRGAGRAENSLSPLSPTPLVPLISCVSLISPLPIAEKNLPEMVSRAVSSARIPRLFSLS